MTLTSPTVISGLAIYRNVTLTTGVTGGPALTCNGLTVGDITQPANFILERSVSGSNTDFVVSAQALTLRANSKILRPLPYSYAVWIQLRRENVGGISMANVTNAYVGVGVNTSITSGNLNDPGSPFLSDVRFDDDVTFTVNTILLAQHNLFLGKACTLIVPATAAGEPGTIGRDDGYFGFSSNHTGAGIGRLCREVGPTAWGPLFFPVAPIDGDRSGKYVPLRVQITGCSGPFSSSTQPFPYVSARVVGIKHPMNLQTSPELHLYWVVEGIGTPDANGGSACVTVDMWYHNYYKTGGTDNVVFSARYTDNYEDGVFGSGWNMDGTQQNQAFSSGDYISYFRAGTPCTTGFGDFTIGFGTPGGDPIPVELTSFDARCYDGAVNLTWRTATELNNFGFMIERSRDSKIWEEIEFVPGAGTSNTPKSYAFTDNIAAELQGIPELAYRLRQMDRDGSIEYSNIVFVKTGSLPDTPVLYPAYPNPFNPSTTISYSVSQTTVVTLKVYDALGRVVGTLLNSVETAPGVHTAAFDGGTLASGVYTVVLQASGSVQHQKIILNR
ncbi:MAG: T9SS type A sorting domain-containing protein [Bacteroidota bacterium]